MPPSTADDRLDAILADYFERLDRGEAVAPQSLIDTHPDLADSLREFLDAADFVSGFAGPTLAEHQQSLSVHDTSRNSLLGETLVSGVVPSPKGHAEPNLGKHFGRYQIERTLGAGAMGTVYLAYDPQLERRVALKMPKFGAGAGEELRQRFLREARAAATLRSPNICPVYDVGEIAGQLYISMAHIDGRSLAEELKSGRRFTPQEAASIVARLARALHKAHSRKIVHRDLKPGNVMLDAEGEPVLMDFGLAHRTEGDDLRLTSSGMLVGSPAYMSPEQVEGDAARIGPASDVYSLGVVLYELLTGKLPFQGSIMSVIGQIAGKSPELIGATRPELANSPLERLCLKMMAKLPADRPASMQEVAEALECVLGPVGNALRGAAIDPAPAKWTDPGAIVSAPIPLRRAGHRDFTGWIAAGVAVATLALFGALAGIIYVATDQGTLQITSKVDDVQVVVSKDGREVAILDLKTGGSVKRLPSGDYDVELKGTRNDVKLDRGGFKLTRGETEIVSVLLVPKMVALVPPVMKPAAIPAAFPLPADQPRYLQGHTAAVSRAVADASGRKVFTAGFDGTARLFDVGTGIELLRLPASSGWVWGCAISRDGKRGLTCGQGSHALVWNLESGQPETELVGLLGAPVAVEFTDDESQVLGAGIDGNVYLWKTTGELVHTLRGHTEAVWDVVGVPGGKQAVSVGADKIARRWDLESGKELKQYAGHELTIGHVDVSPSGTLIATSSHDGTVRVWNLETAEQLSSYAGHKKAAQGVAFTRDGKSVLSGDYNGVLCLTDALTGEEIWRTQGHGSVLGDVAVSRDGLHVISAGHDKLVRVARLPDTTRLPRLIRQLGQHDEWVMGVAFRPQGDLVASVGADEVIRLWHPASGEKKAELKQHAADIRSIHFSADGKSFVTASHDRTIKVWDAARDLALVQTLRGHNDFISAAVLLPGGKRLVSGSDDKTLILWDMAEAKPLHLVEFHTGAVSCLALASDGKTLASSGKDNQVVISQVVEDKIELRHRLPGHEAEVRGLAFTPDAGQLVSTSRDGTVRVWNVESGQLLRTLQPNVGIVYCAAFSPSGQLLAVGGGDWTRGSVKIYDFAAGHLLAEINSFAGFVHGLAFSSDGAMLATGGAEGAVTLWRLPPLPPWLDSQGAAEIKSARRLPGHDGPVFRLALAADGRSALSTSDDYSTRQWDLQTGQPTGHYKANGAMRAVAISSDGRRAAWSGGMKAIVVWNLAENKEFKTLAGHENWVYSLQFTKDAARLLSASRDGSVRLWDLATGQTVFTLPTTTRQDLVARLSPDESRLLAHAEDASALTVWDLTTKQVIARLPGHGGDGAFAAAWSPDGTRIASGDSRGDLLLWDAASGRCLSRSSAHAGRLTGLAFTSDGKCLVSGGFDGALNLWDAETQRLLARATLPARVTNEVLILPGDKQVLTAGGWYLDPGGNYVVEKDHALHLWDLPAQ